MSSGNNNTMESLDCEKRDSPSSMDGDDINETTDIPAAEESSNQKSERLVHWNCVLLTELLQRVISARGDNQTVNIVDSDLTTAARMIAHRSCAVDQVVDEVELPHFVPSPTAQTVVDKLPDEVAHQLEAFVSKIASMYKENPFHNFKHASHVTMSVSKLLGRIVPSEDALEGEAGTIMSDPLTQFAVTLAALIHDLDHPGVANGQLMQEDPKLAARYKNKSVAEQNSVDLAWDALMLPEFAQLRKAIFPTEQELLRFRQLLVNSIIATDIFDKERSDLRANGWNKVFRGTSGLLNEADKQRLARRKATLVLEHLIQASDVAHTMQHWHIYQKWNQRLFNEMMMAYRAGRSTKDPALGWYKGELWFFDNYVIPLAQKLKECDAFGVASDEYHNYAKQNRTEWESKGMNVVAQYLKEFDANNGTQQHMIHQRVAV